MYACVRLKSEGRHTSLRIVQTSSTTLSLLIGIDVIHMISLVAPFISGCFRNGVGEGYRLQYAFFFNLVARTRVAWSYLMSCKLLLNCLQVVSNGCGLGLRHLPLCHCDPLP